MVSISCFKILVQRSCQHNFPAVHCKTSNKSTICCVLITKFHDNFLRSWYWNRTKRRANIGLVSDICLFVCLCLWPVVTSKMVSLGVFFLAFILLKMQLILKAFPVCVCPDVSCVEFLYHSARNVSVLTRLFSVFFASACRNVSFYNVTCQL